MTSLPQAPFPILTSVAELRAWRSEQESQGRSVGFVPTMGALHDGHLSLVDESLRNNDTTVVSIFVNPAQFAPHEDLSTYPRTLESDLAALKTCSFTPLSPSSGASNRTVSALFLPPAEALYPSGITTDVSKQRGTFIEVKGLQDSMEGKSRPGFFRGVATVVLKLFNLVQPSRAYFGQKDIQQALLLRRLCLDLHVPHPTPENLVIVPTFRNPKTHLALSSRNAYLSKAEFEYSTVLVDALRAAEAEWDLECSQHNGRVSVDKVIRKAEDHVRSVEAQVQGVEGVEVKLLYIALNDPEELGDLEGYAEKGKGALLSGAVMLGKTRLIDNFVLGDFNLNHPSTA
ncbi:pantoate--beta-alanine ligase PAN6 [Sporobolomyces koalae]|uniref:pantoate--beta-alanine ligase PAN6 n=1 Tax=Sporobolomyces koalae TaxID=500713 RepID=UPI00316FA500